MAVIHLGEGSSSGSSGWSGFGGGSFGGGGSGGEMVELNSEDNFFPKNIIHIPNIK
ncbi:MAG: hypothetical protein KatS3mg027_1783 [Bacteroidia bacterium]|nr:MAG: hypothetical protein KatS3mg027_1783 [Bacteroidia bacterium]